MTETNNKKEASIIEIIQKMVRENEPEEQILKTLQSMGVSEDQAKRLLLIAQADTFTLLSSEISKMVKSGIGEQQEAIKKESQAYAEKLIKEREENVKKEIEKEFLKHKVLLSDTQKSFQDSVNESISKIAKLNEEVYISSKDNKNMIEIMKKDLNETKLKGIKVRRSIARNAILAFGIICFILSLIIVISGIMTTINLDYLTGAVVLAFAGAIITYFSLNI